MMTEVKEADKTNNASLSAYIGTVRLAFVQQVKMPCTARFFTPHPSKIKDFCHLLPKEKAIFHYAF